MIGAIAGDLIGSRWRRGGMKETNFELFDETSRFTDDTVLTVALADALLHGFDYALIYQAYFREYPRAGYGPWFTEWALRRSLSPYGSYDNDAAVRVPPVAWAFSSLPDAVAEARRSAVTTHDHEDAIRGAEAVAAAVFLARSEVTVGEIRALIEMQFGYDLSRSLDEIRRTYAFDLSASHSVPEAIVAFLEGSDWESAVRNAVSLGGDGSMAAIAGALAEARYGVPEAVVRRARAMLDDSLLRVIDSFEDRFGSGSNGRSSAGRESLTADSRTTAPQEGTRQ